MLLDGVEIGRKTLNKLLCYIYAVTKMSIIHVIFSSTAICYHLSLSHKQLCKKCIDISISNTWCFIDFFVCSDFYCST